MGNDVVSTFGFVIEVAKASVLVGRAWHWVIERVNAQVDQWLWEEDWAWANGNRYRVAQG